MRKTSIGGQALIEGLLMIGPDKAAIAVRKPDGEIIVEQRPLPGKSVISKIPVVRGAFNLFRQMVLGVKALMFSADFVDTDEDEEAKSSEPSRVTEFFRKLLGQGFLDFVKGIGESVKKRLGDKIFDWMIYITVIISLGLSILLFILLPNWIAGLLPLDKSRTGIFLYNLIEGILRIGIFLVYLSLTSRMKEIQRVWEYHGAEHKTIHCYEHEEDLTAENVMKYSTKHPRCGTSFIFLVLVVSIIVFSLLGKYSIIINTLLRLLLIPVIAGISYEILKFAGRSELKIMKLVNAPGMLFQLFTTREPDEQQVEVAIAAFNSALSQEKDADKW